MDHNTHMHTTDKGSAYTAGGRLMREHQPIYSDNVGTIQMEKGSLGINRENQNRTKWIWRQTFG